MNLFKRFDLFNKLLNDIKNNPYGRRHILSLWQDIEFDEELNTTVLKGQIGIESGLDGRLSGIDQYKTNLDNNIQADFLSGDDVYLTLDSRLQNFMEDLLLIIKWILMKHKKLLRATSLKSGD